MRNLRAQEEIMATWKGEHDKPVVSICCITYNHEPYIEDTLEGFLIQQTDFPFEVLIHDDASTDLTTKIIREYQSAYPKLIKPIFQAENQYSRGMKPLQFLMPKCLGHFVAYCEGDDFWVDPKKLQIQVDFLDKNPAYVISGHDAYLINESGQKIQDSKLPHKYKRDFSEEELKKGHAWILTLSWVFRNVISEYTPERLMVKNGDKFFTSIIGEYGKSHYHSDIASAAYRVHKGGVWSSSSDEEKLHSLMNTYYWLSRYYSRQGDSTLKKHFWGLYVRKVIQMTELFSLFREVFLRLSFTREFKFFVRRLFNQK